MLHNWRTHLAYKYRLFAWHPRFLTVLFEIIGSLFLFPSPSYIFSCLFSLTAQCQKDHCFRVSQDLPYFLGITSR